MFTLDASGRGFLKEGRPHFFVLDTAWFALMNLTYEEFCEYALFRKNQGFNALLMQNTPSFQDMPVTVRYLPFPVKENGDYDLEHPNQAYFDLVERKLAYLQSIDMTAFLALVWGSFIPESVMSRIYDCSGRQFTDFDAFARLVDGCIERYRAYHPVWLIGGDVPLGDDNEINKRYYGYMARRIRERCPGDLISAHLGGNSALGDFYLDNGYIDFYTYQSSHCYDAHDDLLLPAVMGEQGYRRTPVKPVMNLEPMYEAHGYGNRFGRFDALFLRRAFWYSVLSGANAGFAYGAHGIWMFYDGSGFNNERWSKEPLLWRTALRLPGACDVTYCADLLGRYGGGALEPAQALNLTGYPEIRVAASPDQSLIIVYQPAACALYLGVDLSGYHLRRHLLGDAKAVESPLSRMYRGAELAAIIRGRGQRQFYPTPVAEGLEECERVSVVDQYQANCDAILVCERR